MAAIIYCLMIMPWFRWLIASSQGELFEICGRESGTGTGVLVSLANHHFANAIYSFICHPKNRQWAHQRMQFRRWSFTLTKGNEQYYPVSTTSMWYTIIMYRISFGNRPNFASQIWITEQDTDLESPKENTVPIDILYYI